MLHAPDEKNQITLESEFTVYNPKLAFTMKFPGPEFCGDNGDIMMVVGSVPQVGPRSVSVGGRKSGIMRIAEQFFLCRSESQTVIGCHKHSICKGPDKGFQAYFVVLPCQYKN